MQPKVGENNLELHYIDTESFLLSFKLIKGIIKDLKHLKKILILVIQIHPMNYIQKTMKSCWRNETGNGPTINFYEAVFLRRSFYSVIIKQNHSHCKHEGVQEDKCHTLDKWKSYLENKEFKYGVDYSFRSNKHETSTVKQKKIA